MLFNPRATASKNRIPNSYLFSWYSLYVSIRDMCTKFVEKSACAEHSDRIFDVRTVLESSTCLFCVIRFLSFKNMFLITYKHIKKVKSYPKRYSSILFEVLTQTENILFLNTINILMEYDPIVIEFIKLRYRCDF